MRERERERERAYISVEWGRKRDRYKFGGDWYGKGKKTWGRRMWTLIRMWAKYAWE